MSRRPTTSPTPKHSAHHPVVVSKHESCADGISKGADLLLPKHELQERARSTFRPSAVSAAAAGGQISWKFPESCFLSRGQISKRKSRNLYQGQRDVPVPGSALRRPLVPGLCPPYACLRDAGPVAPVGRPLLRSPIVASLGSLSCMMCSAWARPTSWTYRHTWLGDKVHPHCRADSIGYTLGGGPPDCTPVP